jgi:hypothetical protein
MDQSEFEAGLAEFQKPDGKFNEAYRSGFRDAPDIKQKYDELYRQRYPDSEPVPAPNTAKPKDNRRPQADPLKMNDEAEYQKAAAEYEKKMSDFRPGGVYWPARRNDFKDQPLLKRYFRDIGVDPVAATFRPVPSAEPGPGSARG